MLTTLYLFLVVCYVLDWDMIFDTSDIGFGWGLIINSSDVSAVASFPKHHTSFETLFYTLSWLLMFGQVEVCGIRHKQDCHQTVTNYT